MASGWVPGRQAEHETPSVPISLGPQLSQKVESSLNVHWLPSAHGFWPQSSMVVATSHAAVDEASTGASMVVFVMRTLSAAVTDSVAPLGAALVRKTASLMVVDMGPAVLIAPPLPEVTRNSWLDHMAMPRGQQASMFCMFAQAANMQPEN